MTPSELWQKTVADWKTANGFIKDLRSPDLNKPYSELTGLEKACVKRFNSQLIETRLFKPTDNLVWIGRSLYQERC